MKLAFIAIVIIAAALELASAQVNYCTLRSCPNRSHTLCRYPTAGPSATCPAIISSGLSNAEKQRIVNIHNLFRQRVANGNEARGSPGPQPNAASMPNLVWNDQIATIAQRWADQCQKAIDSCRNIPSYYVNQNFGYSGTTGNVNSITVESIVQYWYDQVDFSNKAAIDNFTGTGANGNNIGSFSQIVWSGSTDIGCGAIRYKDGIYNTLFLICNYGPGGNIIGEYIYETI